MEKNEKMKQKKRFMCTVLKKKGAKKREKIQNNRLRTPVGKSPLCVTFSRKNVFELFFPFMCKKKKNVGKTRLRPGFCRKKFSKKMAHVFYVHQFC